MTHRWVIKDFDHEVLRTTEAFESQPAAESWLRENWEALLDEGACSVELKAEDRILYEMGLEPA